MRQVIVTNFLGPTKSRVGRIKATAAAGTITVPFDYQVGSDTNHARAAFALAHKLCWSGSWIAGGMPDGGCVYTNIPSRTLSQKEVTFFVPIAWRAA